MIALPRAAPPTSRIACDGGLGELVDVGPRAGSGGARGDRGDDLGVRHRRDPGDRGDDRDRRLPAAGHHVDVVLVEVRVEVDRRHHERADGRRGQVDQPLAVRRESFSALATCALALVASKTMSISSKPGIAISPSTPSCGGGDAEALRAGEPVGLGVDADHGAHLEGVGEAHHLDHQVGADVARPDDGDLDLAHFCSFRAGSFENVAVTEPRPGMSAVTTAPGVHVAHRSQRAGQHDLAGAQRVAVVACGAGQPGERVERVAQARGAVAGGDHLAVEAHRHGRARPARSRRGSGARCPARRARWRRCRPRCRRSGCPSPGRGCPRSPGPRPRGRRRHAPGRRRAGPRRGRP